MLRNAVLMAAMCVAFAATPRAADPVPGPFVSGVRYPSLELIDDGQHNRIAVPLDYVEGVDPHTLAARLIEVLVADNRPDGQLIQAFRPALTADGMDVDVDFSLVRRAASYRLTIDLVETKPENGKPARRQRIDVVLNHPAAKLRLPPAMLIFRTQGILSGWIAPSAFKVFEDSRRSRVTLQFERLTASHEGLPVAGTIGFKDLDLPLGKSAEMVPEMSGRFPIGSTKATMLARAEQLDETVAFDVEIRTRRPGWWVFPIILISALVGWVLRVYLKHQEDFYALAAQGDTLVAALEQDRPTTLEYLRPILGTAITSIKAAILAGDEKVLTDAIRDGNAALADSQARRKQWRTDALETLGKARAALDLPWQLPVPADLAEMRRTVNDAIARALDGDIGEASARQAELRRQLTALVEPGRTWAQHATQAVAESEKALEAKVPERPVAKTTADALAAAAALDVTAPQMAEALLKTLHTAQATLVTYATDTAWQVGRLGDDIVEALRGPAEAEAIRAAAVIGGDPASSPITVVGAVPAAIKSIREGLRTAIATIAPELGPEAAKEMRELLESGHFVQAARQAAAAAADDDGRMRIAAESRATVTASVRQAPASQGQPISVGSATQFFVVDDLQVPEDPMPVNSLKRLFVARLIRGVSAAFIAASAALLLYHDTFVGTPTEILGLATLGFLSDFTVESAIDAVVKPRS